MYGYFSSENITFDWTTVYLCVAILFVDAYYTLFYTVFLKKRIKKNPQINAQITYEFTEDALIANTISEKINDITVMKYDIIYRVTESEHFLYIYVHPNAAHIIDISGFPEGSVDELKTLLKNKLSARKIRF